MKYIVEKDKKRRELFRKNELKRNYLKAIINNSSISGHTKLNAMLKLTRMPKDSSVVRVKNRCIITGRARSVYRDFKISRIILRKYAHSGLLPGIHKASW